MRQQIRRHLQSDCHVFLLDDEVTLQLGPCPRSTSGMDERHSLLPVRRHRGMPDGSGRGYLELERGFVEQFGSDRL